MRFVCIFGCYSEACDVWYDGRKVDSGYCLSWFLSVCIESAQFAHEHVVLFGGFQFNCMRGKFRRGRLSSNQRKVDAFCFCHFFGECSAALWGGFSVVGASRHE